jgi:hypothetical protein
VGVHGSTALALAVQKVQMRTFLFILLFIQVTYAGSGDSSYANEEDNRTVSFSVNNLPWKASKFAASWWFQKNNGICLVLGNSFENNSYEEGENEVFAAKNISFYLYWIYRHPIKNIKEMYLRAGGGGCFGVSYSSKEGLRNYRYIVGLPIGIEHFLFNSVNNISYSVFGEIYFANKTYIETTSQKYFRNNEVGLIPRFNLTFYIK